jgi:hypothetical protein
MFDEALELSGGRLATKETGGVVSQQTIELTISKSEAEVLLGVLAAERHNAEAQAVCDSVREQIDEKLRGAESD